MTVSKAHDMQKLTPSQENYLEWIYRLASEKGFVRTGEVAEKMKVKLPSVSRAVRGLVKVGLVDHKSYGKIELTDKGRRVGELIVRRDECLTRFLVQILGMEPKKAETEVHRLEHALNEEVLCRLEVLVDFALSSEAWMKRLGHRILNNISGLSRDSDFRIGETIVHGGRKQEKSE
jgi:Mn-dependent DtxR family transcriptional regulator